MSAPDDDRLMHHEYDGIQEYDNPLPFWWKGLFVLTIAHSAAYLYWFHGGGPGKTPQQEYAADLKAHEKLVASAPRPAIEVSEESLAELAKDSSVLARGQQVFVKNCASCHTEDGRGLVGPNLTDRFQIHGSSRMDVYQTVVDGVLDKGMLAWGPVLPPDDLAATVSFVVSLRGKDVAGGKPPEGRKVDPFN